MIAAMLLFGGAVMAAGPECKAEQARYTLKSDPNYTLSFPKIGPAASAVSDLHARLDIAANENMPAQTLWFQFSQSNGYSVTRLIPASDPRLEEDIENQDKDQDERSDDTDLTLPQFLSFDAGMNALGPPASGADAPKWVLLPDIGPALWYSASDYGVTFPAGQSHFIDMPPVMFALTQCNSD